MIRINLLPPEILEKRKDEARWRWVLLGGVVAFAVLLVFFTVMYFQVTVKQGEVAATEQEVQTLQQQADQVKIFKEQEDALSQRRKIVAKATLGRVDWARLLYEVSLVMPPDIWLTNITGVEDDPLTSTPAGQVADQSAPTNESNVTLTGIAIDADVLPDLGFKSIAKFLVRLSELEQLQRVWLTSATKHPLDEVESTAGEQTQNTDEFRTPPNIDFAIEAQMPEIQQPAEEDAASVAAPPATTAP